MTKKNITAKNTPRVGVGLIIKQNDKIMLGRRLNQPMRDSWQLPGGWIFLGESPEQAVHRQLNEFQGGEFGESKFVTYTNNIFDEYTHTLSLYFMVDCLNKQKLKIVNTEKGADWFWADWNNLPQTLFLPLQKLTKSGFNPFKCDG